MKVYLVEDCQDAPGRIYAVYRNEEDAVHHMEQFLDPHTAAQVVERTLCFGQQCSRYVE